MIYFFGGEIPNVVQMVQIVDQRQLTTDKSLLLPIKKYLKTMFQSWVTTRKLGEIAIFSRLRIGFDTLSTWIGLKQERGSWFPRSGFIDFFGSMVLIIGFEAIYYFARIYHQCMNPVVIFFDIFVRLRILMWKVFLDDLHYKQINIAGILIEINN